MQFVQSVSSALRAFMKEKHLGQAKLAKQLKISQSTVSRAVNGLPIKHGAARSKLFIYAGIIEPTQQVPPKKGPQRVMSAFHRIWDGTEIHADAVAKIIDALDDLRPVRKKRG